MIREHYQFMLPHMDDGEFARYLRLNCHDVTLALRQQVGGMWFFHKTIIKYYGQLLGTIKDRTIKEDECYKEIQRRLAS